MAPLLTALAAVFVVFAPVQAEMPTVRFTYADVQPEPVEPPPEPPIAPQNVETQQEPSYDPYSLECSCVRYIREIQGIPIRGDASTHKPNTPLKEAQRGDVLILKYPTDYHVAFIEQPMPGGLYISERNWKHCRYTERLIPWDDPHVIGVLRI